MRGYSRSEAVFKGYDSEAEANREWNELREMMELEQAAQRGQRGGAQEHAEMNGAAPRDREVNGRNTRESIQYPSPSISSESTRTSQNGNQASYQRRIRRDSSLERDSNSTPSRQQRVSVSTSCTTSASNRAERTEVKPILLHKRNRPREAQPVVQARQQTPQAEPVTEFEEHPTSWATVDTSYSLGDQDVEVVGTPRTSRLASEQSRTDISDSMLLRREESFNDTPRTSGRFVPAIPMALSSPVGRKVPTNLNRTPKNRVPSIISISTDDSEDDEAVASYNAAAQAKRLSSFQECGQNLKNAARSTPKGKEPSCNSVALTPSLSGSPTSSPNKASKLPANGKTARSNGTKQKGTGCPSPRQGQSSSVASGSRGGSGSSRAPNMQRSSTLPAVASGSSQRDNTIPRAMTSPPRVFGALLGPAPPKKSVVHGPSADPRSPVRRDLSPLEPSCVMAFDRPSPPYPNLRSFGI
ncbi:hypothetical protein HWV62_15583 [Athelia sp. TMB]|nr:hypothetical protein HWV62_15583 [Athelia sp. TMB]